MKDGAATVRIDMLEGDLGPMGAPIGMTNLKKTAREAGATSLRIEASVANPELYDSLVKRYGMRTEGATDIIEVALPAATTP